jgi:cytidylate kinase
MIVTIDGPAGSGKSTVAHALADKCALIFLDTGALYRCVALASLQRKVDLDDSVAVAEVARGIHISFGSDGARQTVQLDGTDVTDAIRTPEVDIAASTVSAIPEVRSAMLGIQHDVAAQGDVVAEGRDLGTVVFPEAEVKVFLTADPAARAHRRAVQRSGGDTAVDDEPTSDAELEKSILEDILRRDRQDSTRETAPLRPADDATHIDSSELSVDEVVERIEALMAAARSAL